MEILVPNSVEAAVEKHVPTYEKVEDEIFVKVNLVMEKEHYIEWVALVKDNKECLVNLYPEQNAINFQSPTKHCKKVNARKCKMLWKYSKIYWLDNAS